ncbi:MAG: AMP-binding protein [Rhodospirillaceae bacterium]|nr:AMP-binding protein [Rhodospirillaceae bacterium]MBT6883944.1 AMP-binding protein [Rhodospirillaceae bacterium]MBT7509839.1 AMP-binding protein [Rhodospirillaceae bacterium]
MLTKAETYEDLYCNFGWDIPDIFNMGVDVCDKHALATPSKPGLIVVDPGRPTITYTFADLKRLSDKLANLFTAKGLERGERVGILMSQSVEAAISHVAAWKMAAVSIPLFTLFGEDALKFRLQNAGARMLVTDTENLPKIEAIRDELPDLRSILVVDLGSGDGSLIDFWGAMEKASDSFTPVETSCEDPSFICYTSGTTGNPKGALHAHRTMFGHLSGMEMFHDFLPQDGDRMWTPADWAWIGGLMNCLMCSWHHGVTNVAYRAKKYDPEESLRLMADYEIRNSFMPPTALNLMRQVSDIPSFGTRMRTIAVAGEPMGAELFHWGKENLGITFNEFYGQTECNLIVANCQEIMPPKPGAMGRAAPGHIVEIVDDDGNVLGPGEEGEIAVRRAGDPVLLLEYWRNAEATAEKTRDDWWRMGDAGTKDEDGYFWFVGRADDVITSAGYRIGPGEIEDCLCKHPAVTLAAAIGVPDPVRTENIKVFIKLAAGHNGSPELGKDIQAFVKKHLSPHEYPRLIEFVSDLPMTATGKIKRKDLRDAEIAKS